MIKILRERRTWEEYEYYVLYESKVEPGSGFMFPCDKEGDINFSEMSEYMLKNYETCDTSENYVYCGLQRSVNRRSEPKVGQCYCGEEVVLAHNTNYCEHCNRIYNAFGQELRKPKFWGEETGEHPIDIEREM